MTLPPYITQAADTFEATLRMTKHSNRSLAVQADAAKALISSMNEALADDDELRADMVEGETELFEALQRAVNRIGEIDAHVHGLSEYAKTISARKSRLEKQAENIRLAIAGALSVTGIKSRELDGATLSLRDKAREPVVVDESLIPDEFWKPQDPKLDRAALRAAAKAGRAIPGITLDNGGTSLTIRRT